MRYGHIGAFSLAISLLAAQSLAQVSGQHPERTVATIGAASSHAGKVFVVTDGANATDCDTTGSGSTRVACLSDGTNWVALTASGGPPSGAAGGDLGGTYPNPTVDDDGHAHTLATLPSNVVTVCATNCDYATIKGALDWVATQTPSTSNAFTVEVSPGIYSETCPLTMPTDTDLVALNNAAGGQTSTSTYLKCSDPATQHVSGALITMPARSSIDGFYIEGANVTATGDRHLIQVTGTQTAITHCWLFMTGVAGTGFVTSAIYYSAGGNLGLDSVRINMNKPDESDGSGIRVNSTGKVLARNVYFSMSGTSMYALRLDNSGADYEDYGGTSRFPSGAGWLNNLGGATVILYKDVADTDQPGELQLPTDCSAGEALSTGSVDSWDLECVTAGGVGNALDTEVVYNNAGTLDGSVLTTDGTNITQASGQLLTPDGTVALPAIAPASNPDTGIQWSTANEMRVQINEIYEFTVTSSGPQLPSGNDWRGASNSKLMWVGDTNTYIVHGTDEVYIYAGGQLVVEASDVLAAGAAPLTSADDGTSQIVYVSPAAGNTAAPLNIGTMDSAPASCVIGDIYFDSSGAYCACTSTNTWENTTATGACT